MDSSEPTAETPPVPTAPPEDAAEAEPGPSPESPDSMGWTKVRSPRIPIRVRDAERTVDTTYDDYILEIDKNRVFIRTDSPLPVGTELHLQFNLKGAPRPVHLRGEVVRISAGTGPKESVLGKGMGIVFLNISFDNARLISDYLNVISSSQKGEEYSTFLHWVETLERPLSPDERVSIRRRWLQHIIDTGTPEEGRRAAEALKKKAFKGRRVSGQELEPFKAVDLFEDLTDDELQRVAGICRKEEYVAGEKVFEEGAVGDTIRVRMEPRNNLVLARVVDSRRVRLASQ